ncbi:MAG: sulfur oxidation c-type cytochrome SoxX [Gammaproteobacteria bacterium]|jgi:L-cysteine S-thiosulfotransferase
MITRRRDLTASAVALAITAIAFGATAAESPKGDIAAGKAIAMDRAKGNCIACHVLPGGDSPGAIGPALVAMKSRFPSKEALAKQIWDPTVRNPDTVMPPFGKHAILTEQEFNDVVDYIWSL